MWVFWICTLIPLIIGAILWYRENDVVWWEWLTGFAVALLTALIFQYVSVIGMTGDTELWSGSITNSRHFAAWEEYYEYAVYRTEYYYETETETDSKGRSHTHRVQKSREVFDHWEPTSRWHSDVYTLYSNIDTSYDINKAEWYELAERFGGFNKTRGDRTTGEHNSRMIGGDPNDYVSSNTKGYVKPCIKHKSFENRIKAAPSLFSFAKVPKDTKVYDYPKNESWWQSDRLLGTASKDIPIFAFDQMNARLGPTKKVNVVMIGFGDQDHIIAQWQQAAWIGGKKNDLVLCYGAGWSFVFGWSESEIVKRNLETVLIDHPVNSEILPLIEATINDGYEKKNWTKFSYITVEPPAWSYWVYFLVLGITQGIFWLWARENDFTK